MKETKWIKFLKFIGAIPAKIEKTKSIEERIKNRKDYQWRNSGR